jgi:hypothetical protein
VVVTDPRRRHARGVSRGLGLLLIFAAISGTTQRAQADEASGTWTGELDGRANYYWERSTRVVVPTARLSLEAPNGIRMEADYLVDVIASASIAQTGGGKDGVFTELRHGIGAGAGKRFSVGNNDLDISFHGVYSTESDYKSWLYGVTTSYAFNDKDTAISLGLLGVSDTVLSNANPSFRGKLNGVTASLNLTQVLSPVLLGSIGYEIVNLEGFLGNPYRNAVVGALPHPEAPPDTRLRHNIQASVSWFLPATSSTLELYGRVYTDSWKMFALTPEARIYQQLGRDWVVRLRYRFYDQTKAYFALPDGQTRYVQGYVGPLTNDPKLSAFRSQQIGGRIEWALAGLSGSFLDFISRGVLDLSVDYQWCSSSFGNNVIGTAGGRLPF